MKIVMFAILATLAAISICQGSPLSAVKREAETSALDSSGTAVEYHRDRRSEDAVAADGIQERQLIVINGQAGSGGSTGGGNNRGRRPGNGPGNRPFRGPGGGGFRGSGNGNRGPGGGPFRGPPRRGGGWRNRGNQFRDDRDDFDGNNNQGGGDGGGGGGGGGIGVCILCIGLRNNPQATTLKP